MGESQLDIAGLGAVTGYGWGREKLWQGLATGESAASPLAGYQDDGQGSAWAATVPDEGDPSDGPSRFQQAMRFAAREAIADAGARGWQPGRRVGLLHAVVLGEVDLWKDFYVAHDGRVSVRDYLALMPSTPISTLMQEHGFHGPAMNVGAMCASGNAGLLTAKSWIDTGIVDDVVFVATDLSVTPENLRHFAKLGVTITDTEPLQACRPFQEGTQGFIMGEGSIGMVLSRNTSAPYMHMLGGAMSHDAHHVTSIDPELTDVTRCFNEALDNAGVSADQVRYLNAHGPGTQQCDKAESTVFDTVFPANAELYSVKPLAGHCQGAASAVEITATALGYDHNLLPAPRPVAAGHPRLLTGPTPPAAGLTVNSSIGMGGHNSATVLNSPNT